MLEDMRIIAEADTNQSVIGSEPLAQAEGNAVTVQDGGTPRPSPQPPWLNIGLMAVLFLFLYLILFREPRKKQQQHKKMLASLQKNDKVCTIGGIIGTVVEVKGDEVVVKVDDSNNTKLRVRTSAIAANLSASEKKTS